MDPPPVAAQLLPLHSYLPFPPLPSAPYPALGCYSYLLIERSAQKPGQLVSPLCRLCGTCWAFPAGGQAGRSQSWEPTVISTARISASFDEV